MEYSDEFTIKIYDLGGHERIRDIWTNYYAEVHGIMYVVDISDEERLEENYETIRKLQLHKGTSRKPFLVVLNKKKPTELDDFDFSINADLNSVGADQGQMIFITHVNEYKGELDHAKNPPPMVSKRPRRVDNPLLTQFCSFIDKIIEHYVFLSEGVRSAELALQLRQQAEREDRRMRLMRQEQEREEQVSMENTQAPASDPPSVSDTQSPANDSPHPSVSHISSEAHISSEVFIETAADGPEPAPLPRPVPPKPARNRVVPMNGNVRPPSAPRNPEVFTVDWPTQQEAPIVEKPPEDDTVRLSTSTAPKETRTPKRDMIYLPLHTLLTSYDRSAKKEG
ncbi:unnamed protein product [Nippostrongylus brasiliensis]|uniref:ADP-ribosylation factor-like protein 13B (inferred by orthology to a C. elegans protein) n=1 Tax=Nippostrongylus brasiliensis TaxID=27835 RepID=A0A0N4YA00_NIPBR|nr:unnamed protein product [Nippostrongylus brasiliensis]